MLGLKSVQLGQEYTINMDAGVLLRSVKLPVRRRQVIITDVDVQQREGCSMRINHTISTDEGVVPISHPISKEEDVHYRTTKTARGVVGGCIHVAE